MVGGSIYGVVGKTVLQCANNLDVFDILFITFGRKALTLTAQVISGNSPDAMGLADLRWTNAIIASSS